MLKAIVGLGNPGSKYAGTRHNVGFDVVDLVASRCGVSLTVEKFHGWFGQGDLAGERIVLLKPTTFMNRSGRALVALGQFYKMELEDLLVVADDHALPLGRLRLRAKGSAGGHNGLQDIVDRVGSDQWCRLRVGIGRPLGDSSAYVLTRFAKDEEVVMQPARMRAAEAAESWVAKGVDLTMTRFNGDPDATMRGSNGEETSD